MNWIRRYFLAFDVMPHLDRKLFGIRNHDHSVYDLP
jgi:hypothetical protein